MSDDPRSANWAVASAAGFPPASGMPSNAGSGTPSGGGSGSQGPLGSSQGLSPSSTPLKKGDQPPEETSKTPSARDLETPPRPIASLNRYFEESDNPDMMDILFGKETGNVRLARIFETYEVRPSPVQVNFFDPQGNRMILGDPVNRDTQRATLQDLKDSILVRGLVPGVAGELWFVCSPGESSPFYALSGGHRTRAVYELVENSPNWQKHPQLAATVRSGVSARRLTYKIPNFVKKFLVDYHNSQAFQAGSGYTYVELLLEVKAMEDAFLVYKSEAISSRGKDYEQKYWQFVSQKYGEKLKSWSHFDSAKTLARRLANLGVDHCSWARNHVDFMHPRLHRPSVVGIMHIISSTIFNSFNGYMLKGDIRVLTSEALKLAVPVRPNPPTQRRVPWIFDKSVADAQEKISFILFVIDDNAKVYKNSLKVKKAKTTRAKSKAAAKPEEDDAAPRAQALSLALESTTDQGESRDRNIGDDIMSSLNVAISEVEVDSQCEEMLEVKSELASYALEFLWEKKVTFKGTVISGWASLRNLLAESAKESAVKFKSFARSSDDAAPGGAKGAAAPPGLLEALRSDAQESPAVKFEAMLASKQDTLLGPFLAFLSHNNAMNVEVRFHLDYPLAFREVCDKLGPAPAVRLRDFLEHCIDQVSMNVAMSDDSLDFVAEVVNRAAQTREVPKVFVDANLATAKHLLKAVRIRGNYALQFIVDFAATRQDADLFDDDNVMLLPSAQMKLLHEAGTSLKPEEVVMVSEADALVRGRGEQIVFWMTFVRGLCQSARGRGGNVAALIAGQPKSRRLKTEKSLEKSPALRVGEAAPVGGGADQGQAAQDSVKGIEHNINLCKPVEIYGIPGLPKGVDVDIRMLKDVTNQLTSWAWDRYADNFQEFKEHIVIDTGAKGKEAAILLNATDEKREGVTPDFEMHFAGVVTAVRPTKNYFPFATLFNGAVEFFMDGNLFNSAASECCVPTWLIHTTEKASEASVETVFRSYGARLKFGVDGRLLVSIDGDASPVDQASKDSKGPEGKQEGGSKKPDTAGPAANDAKAEPDPWKFTITLPFVGAKASKLMNEDYSTSTLIELKRHVTTVEQEEKKRRKSVGKSLAAGTSGLAVSRIRDARAAKRAAAAAELSTAPEAPDARGSKRRRKEDDPLWASCQHLLK